MTPAEKGNSHIESEQLAESAAAPISTHMTARALWWEVTAVLAIGVLPLTCSAYVWTVQAPVKLHYWLDSLELTFSSICMSTAVLYLIYRSNEPWVRFGITRPRFMDFLLAFVLLFGSVCIWAVVDRLGLSSADQSETFFAPPKKAEDYVLMVIKYAASGFTEELVTRAYLITRLKYLLKSSVKAVIFSAAMFASYHVYYGLPSLIDFMAFGLLFGVFFLFVPRIWPLAIGHMLCDITAELLAPK
jgi:membrane protease YdiL (CAAX protease family)